ncbi:DUF6118 family protein [Novosphingobium sp. RL4]|uniref:DUF6118 family protein n=1 Tax=Novosphingobium sp. RL4 TaxID=3109595 RepID=UPI002D79E181|nr:DUF6118 family protein [Novosphingobium sp. RL4]WRT93502.1 DUF6118 family protein [Novosphingobium sp. RL4]
MSEMHTPNELDPAAAFEAMGQRLAGLTAAIDGLAVKFQEMHARDYSTEFAKIEGQFQAVRLTVKEFTERPVMALTPKTVAAQIEAAGRDGRLADQQAWERARRELQAETATIASVVTKARTGEAQKKQMTIAVGATLVFAVFLGGVGRDFVTWMAPASLHFPEQRAAAILGRDEWAAGERLLVVADPQRWAKMQAAIRSVENQSAETGKSANQKANRAGIGRPKAQRLHAAE